MATAAADAAVVADAITKPPGATRGVHDVTFTVSGGEICGPGPP